MALRKRRKREPTIESLETRCLLTAVVVNPPPTISTETVPAPGTIYVANEVGGTIDEISPANIVSTFATGLDAPYGLAFDNSGNLYVCETGNNSIIEIAPSGTISTFATGLDGATFLAIDNSGNLYVGNASNKISKITPGGVVSTFAAVGLPAGLAFDSSGNLYVASNLNGIDKITPGGAVSTFTSAVGGDILGLAFDGSGNLYVVKSPNYLTSSIDKVTPGGVVSTLINSSAVSEPVGIAINASGTIDVSDAGANTVYEFTPGGAETGYVPGMDLPTGIAVQPTIEVGAPSVTLQPSDQTVTAGSMATFSAVASGTPAPTVQWQISTNGGAFTNVAGATSLAYSFTAALGQNGDAYRAVFTNSNGTAITDAATLNVNPPVAAPMITSQPASQSILNGNQALFSAAASGYPAPTVQWQISTNGTTFSNISGAVNSSYGFPTTLPQSGDLFRAVFTNSQGSATTNPATLSVTSIPIITTQPASQSAATGQSVTFTAAAIGGPSPTVQWQSSTNGTTFNNIPGATSATYTFTAAAGQNGSLFRAVFSNSQGQAISNAAALTVTFPPTITTQPANQSIPANQGVSFTAAASGNPAPTVQWQISTNGTTFNNIPGATSVVYTFTTAIAQNGDKFRAVFSNLQGSATTTPASLTVTTSAIAPAITTQPANQNVPAGNQATFSAAASGSPTPGVQWQISTDGTTFNNIPGATADTYSFAATSGQNGNLFRAVFSNSQGSATTNAASLTVPLTAPTITTQPSGESIAPNQIASFTAAASGSPTPTVQWQISTDGTTFSNISGAIAANYSFIAALAQNGDLFRAVFSNSQGSATTNPASLAVTIPLAAPAITTEPTGQSVASNQSASFTAVASGNPTPTVQWQISTDGTTYSDIPGATSATYTFNAAIAQNGNLFRAVFSNSQGSAITNPATLNVTAGPIQLAVTTAPPAVMTLGQVFNVVISADDSSGGGDPTFTGSVTLAVVDSNGNSVALDGPARVTAVNGVATFSGLSVAATGTFSMTASANGAGGTTTANFNVIAVGAPPPAIMPSFGHVTLPDAAVVGAPFKGKVPVIVTNSGAATLKGKFTINVYANANPNLDGNQMLIMSIHSNFALKSGKSRTINANVRALPAGITAGAYYTVAEVVDPNGVGSVTASTQPFQLAAATIALSLTLGNVLPSTIALNHSGSISVIVTNTGNTAASGPLTLTLSPSSDGATPLADMTLAHIAARRLRIAAGKSAKFKLHFKATTAGAYFPYVTVSLTGVTQTGVGSAQFTVG